MDTTHDGRHTGRTPAQWYCLLAGAALLLAGIFGFLADATFDVGNDLSGGDLVVFEVNGWHNIVHILSGLVLLSAFAKRGPAKAVALTFGLVYGLVTIIGLVDGEDVLGLIPVNGPDHALHLALSLVGILAAFASPGDERKRRAGKAGEADERGDRFGRDHDTLSGAPRSDDTITRNR